MLELLELCRMYWGWKGIQNQGEKTEIKKTGEKNPKTTNNLQWEQRYTEQLPKLRQPQASLAMCSQPISPFSPPPPQVS